MEDREKKREREDTRERDRSPHKVPRRKENETPARPVSAAHVASLSAPTTKTNHTRVHTHVPRGSTVFHGITRTGVSALLAEGSGRGRGRGAR